MLERNFANIYTKFKLEFYKKIFIKLEDREASLTAVEVFCTEVIYALRQPTIQEFAQFIGVSSPNAAYKVNSLIKKGYVQKVQSAKDKREYNLAVTQKFLDYYGVTYDYNKEIVKRINERFSEEEARELSRMLGIICDELMFDVDLK